MSCSSRPGSNRTIEAKIVVVLAELEAGLGHFDEARSLYGRSKTIVEELGLRLQLGVQTFAAGTIELLAGNPEAAEVELRVGLGLDRRPGRIVDARGAPRRGRLRAGADTTTQSRLTELSEATAPRRTSPRSSGEVRARSSSPGRESSARPRASPAVGLAAGTDALTVHGDALMNLAEVLRLVGNKAKAAAAAREARGLYEEKGTWCSSHRPRRGSATTLTLLRAGFRFKRIRGVNRRRPLWHITHWKSQSLPPQPEPPPKPEPPPEPEPEGPPIHMAPFIVREQDEPKPAGDTGAGAGAPEA